MTARPFLKYAGSKRRLLPEILKHVPVKIGTYYEPFLGGGSVFFELANQKRFERAVLSDINADLINCYVQVRDNVEKLIAFLYECFIRQHSTPNLQYDRVREGFNGFVSDRNTLTHAARLIYLNHNCFNGLYRVNAAGEFNVPWGHSAKVRGPKPDDLRRASEALQGVEIKRADFSTQLEGVRYRDGDFAYLDPPYVPVSLTSNFTAYAPGKFTAKDQCELATSIGEGHHLGRRILLSNSDCQVTRWLYAGLPITSVRAPRSINSNGAKRGKVGEILVRSFDWGKK